MPQEVNEKHRDGASRHQAIFSLDYATWQDLIDAFEIETSMIPARAEEDTQVGAGGWYG